MKRKFMWDDDSLQLKGNSPWGRGDRGARAAETHREGRVWVIVNNTLLRFWQYNGQVYIYTSSKYQTLATANKSDQNLLQRL